MIQYYLPFLYTHRYNRKGVDGLAYGLEYYGALLLFVILIGKGYESLLVLVIALTVYMMIYECGYIENNVIAIKREKKPTLRHEHHEIEQLRRNFRQICTVRYGVAALLTGLLLFFRSGIEVVLFIVLLFATRSVFMLYNLRFREGFVHRFLFAVLRFLRYFTPIMFWIKPALLLTFPVTLVNIVNNFAWYDRWGIQLPRFFGTKLFDALAYGGFFLLFRSIVHDRMLALVFLYLAVIKTVLFLIVLWRKRGAVYG